MDKPINTFLCKNFLIMNNSIKIVNRGASVPNKVAFAIFVNFNAWKKNTKWKPNTHPASIDLFLL